MPFSVHEPVEPPANIERWRENTYKYRDLWTWEQERLRSFTVACVVAILLLIAGLVTVALAHEHKPGESSEQRRVIEWLQRWHRPKGVFEIEHRVPLCCYAEGGKQDCFRVLQQRVVDGVIEVRPDVGDHDSYDHWYKVDTKVTEDEQLDPLDSPDGQSYVCILGNAVTCFVRGSGV